MLNSLKAQQALPGALSSEIEATLRSLVSGLEALMCERGHQGISGSHGDNVLLDVEVGDVRLLALKRGCPTPMSLLSPREQEIARMVAKGYANKTVASVLEISSWTVASHLRRIFVKLQVSSRAAMATCLLGAGTDELPDLLESMVNDDSAADALSPGIEDDLHLVSSDDLSVSTPS